MSTITIQIGNSDDKLPQREWRAFVIAVRNAIRKHAKTVHFFGAPANYELWQNVAWVVECGEEALPALRAAISEVRITFRQDSAAFTVGFTSFI